MTSLLDALNHGQGIERPFRCEKHDDHFSSATVNVLKKIWHCFACQASGRVDPKSKKAPALADLAAMLNPEEYVRVYPQSYLDLFDFDAGNFAMRFPPWVRWINRLGCDPLSGDSTFPVHTPGRQLAGVGRRVTSPEPGKPRFLYPPRWSASRSLFISGPAQPVVVLTEGASDAAACSETGLFAAAVYGSGVHSPQYELIAQLAPKLVLLGFDSDDAGQRAVAACHDQLAARSEVAVVDWHSIGVKDAAAAPVDERAQLLARTVAGTYYGRANPKFPSGMHVRVLQMQAAHSAREERNAKKGQNA